MRILLACPHCFRADSRPPEAVFVQVADAPLYRFTCAAGHNAAIALQQQRFEVLAMVAVQAIVDGYHREAVSSFTASLERFYEYYVRTIAFTRDVPEEPLDKIWGLVRRESQRQLGMFIAAYMFENKTPPRLLKESDNSNPAATVSFRNKVIHQGKIPSQEEAIVYGQAIIDVVESVLEKMHSRYSEGMEHLLHRHLSEALSAMTEEERVRGASTTSQPEVYRMTTRGSAKTDLAKEIGRRLKTSRGG
jgi:hypothetical protein